MTAESAADAAAPPPPLSGAGDAGRVGGMAGNQRRMAR